MPLVRAGPEPGTAAAADQCEATAPLMGTPGGHYVRKLEGSSLTPREREVLSLLAEGLADSEIAALLHLSMHTIGNHMHLIFVKTGARNRVEAVRWLWSQPADAEQIETAYQSWRERERVRHPRPEREIYEAGYVDGRAG